MEEPRTDPVALLTDKEKECLRLRLGHATAKEIALDLGISHHAVEKRLKMARTKLGATNSLAAARMLADAEGYQQTVAGPPDLSPTGRTGQFALHRSTIIGASIMILATTVALLLAANYQSSEPTEIRLDPGSNKLFDFLDRDKSGYLENDESPFVGVAFTGAPDAEAATDAAPAPDQIAQFYAEADSDADGRVSFREFSAWSDARWAKSGGESKKTIRPIPARPG